MKPNRFILLLLTAALMFFVFGCGEANQDAAPDTCLLYTSHHRRMQSDESLQG